MHFIPRKPLNSVWLKAAVIGSLWASAEIIIGSFLHNLRIPFTGAILSFIGVWLLTGSIQFWKERGLVWRAGAICALMKSISPSAMILGPMIGILTESLILELVLILLGRNLVSYLLAGSLAVFSTLVHKVVSLLILYGFDFLRILESLYYFGVKQIHVESLSPATVVIVLAAIYLVAGTTAAFMGYRAGRLYVKKRPQVIPEYDFTMNAVNRFPETDKKEHYSTLFLLLNFVVIIFILLLINNDNLVSAGILSALYLGFCIIRYKRAMKRFRNKLIWIQFIIIVLSASFLAGSLSGEPFFSTAGLVTGLKMIFRAIIVITGYAAISVEMRNPLIRSIMIRRGFSGLYQSLSLAFAALPGVIATMPQPKEIFKRSSYALSGLFAKAEALLDVITKEDALRSPLVIITGAIGQGKSTFTAGVVESLISGGMKISGFLAVGVQTEGRRIGFDLVDPVTGRRTELCRETGSAESMRVGKYFFSAEGLSMGFELLDPEKTSGVSLILIDEVGPLELNGKGWAPAIERLCERVNLPLLWVVRETVVQEAVKRWKTGDARIFDIRSDDPAAVVAAIRDLVRDSHPVSDQ